MKRIPGKVLVSLVLGVVVWLACPGPVEAEEEEPTRPPDVVGQFQALKPMGEWMGFHEGAYNLSYGGDKHNQGISRFEQQYASYFLVTRSVHDPKDTTVLVVRMGSRGNTRGERLRSNRLSPHAQTKSTKPPDADTVLHALTAPERDWGQSPPGPYVHTGATQIVQGIAPLPLEKPSRVTRDPHAKIAFLDLEGVRSRRPSYLTYEMGFDHGAAAVALTELPDGYYLMALTWGSGTRVRFWKSTVKDLRLLGTSPGKAFVEYDDWHYTEVDGYWPKSGQSVWVPGQGWKKIDSTFQTINFIRQSDDKLYLVGFMNTYNTSPVISGDNIAILYEVTGFEGAPGTLNTIKLRRVAEKAFRVGFGGTLNPGHPKFANFNAGTGVYMSPTGELLFYATEHYDDGPEDSVNMAEYRHRDMYRPWSPNYAPSVAWNPGYGTWEVDEGESVLLDGSFVRPPHARAWAELYADNGYRDLSVVLDVVDRDLENWNHLSTFDQGNEDSGFPLYRSKKGFNDHADAVRWFAPSGSAFRLHKNSPHGGKNLALGGAGKPTGYSKLDDVKMGDTVSAVTFEGRDYGEVTSSRWEIRTQPPMGTLRDVQSYAPLYEAVEGTYTEGEPAVELVDRVVESEFLDPAGAPFRARLTARVTVRNVAPDVTIDRIVDETGRDATGRPPALIAGTEYVLFGHFTDPGIEDAHTATVIWGDGFASHSGEVHCVLWDSLGGDVGLVYMPHVYDAWGTHETVLAVTDDDGDAGEDAWDVVVLGLEDVVKRCSVRLNNRLAQGGLGRKAKRALEKALAKLEGAKGGTTKNGAVHYLGSGKTHLGLLRVHQALKHFVDAVAADASVEGAIKDCRHLLTLGVKGLVDREVREANERTDSWRDLKYVMDAENLVSHGDAGFASGDQVSAVAHYRQAYRKAKKVR